MLMKGKGLLKNNGEAQAGKTEKGCG